MSLQGWVLRRWPLRWFPNTGMGGPQTSRRPLGLLSFSWVFKLPSHLPQKTHHRVERDLQSVWGQGLILGSIVSQVALPVSLPWPLFSPSASPTP